MLRLKREHLFAELFAHKLLYCCCDPGQFMAMEYPFCRILPSVAHTVSAGTGHGE